MLVLDRVIVVGNTLSILWTKEQCKCLELSITLKFNDAGKINAIKTFYCLFNRGTEFKSVISISEVIKVKAKYNLGNNLAAYSIYQILGINNKRGFSKRPLKEIRKYLIKRCLSQIGYILYSLASNHTKDYYRLSRDLIIILLFILKSNKLK